MDKIGLVTVTYNSADVLQPFLNCIYKQSYQDFVLYIIDNDSKDDTISIVLNSNDDRINLIRNKQNKGIAVANNQGIKLALQHNCDQVLIINNDVVFQSSLIDDLVKAQNLCNSSIITPKIFFNDDPQRIWYAGSWFSKLKGYLPTHRGFKEIDNGKYNDIIEVDYAPTCCLLIKKQVFLDVGFMDEKYFVYFDDTDFLYRVWQKDEHKLYYFPCAKIYHKVGSLTNPNNRNKRKFKSNFFIKQFIKNQIYYLRKIGGSLAFIFIIWLFFKNNLKFIFNPKIQKSFSTWILINRSYLNGFKM